MTIDDNNDNGKMMIVMTSMVMTMTTTMMIVVMIINYIISPTSIINIYHLHYYPITTKYFNYNRCNDRHLLYMLVSYYLNHRLIVWFINTYICLYLYIFWFIDSMDLQLWSIVSIVLYEYVCKLIASVCTHSCNFIIYVWICVY